MTAPHVTAAEHPARRHHPLANRCVLALLRSPAHGLLDPGVARVLYPDDTVYAAAVAAYAERHDIRPVPTDRVVVMDLS